MIQLILGRERNLAMAEAERLFGNFELVSEESILLEQGPSLEDLKLGGVIKAASTIQYDGGDLARHISRFILESSEAGKIVFGLSFYGAKKIDRNLPLQIKKVIKSSGRSVRYVSPTEGMVLNAASVIYNKLDSKNFEIIITHTNNGRILLARTRYIQDINDYSKRDYDKPCKDSKVGMLPPKLSQILINLSGARQSDTIVDPFCGSGGLLFEAALMGFESLGSDISTRMTECAQKNIAWFIDQYSPRYRPIIDTSNQDATTRSYPKVPYRVVTEGFLGTNFSSQPSASQINEQLNKLELLYVKFLTNLKNQPKQAESIVMCLPFWISSGQLIDLDILDEINDLGYTIHEFKSVKTSDLRYKRDGQYTGRRIIVLN